MVDFFTIILFLVFLAGLAIAYVIGFKSGVFRRDKYWQDELPGHRKDAIMKSRAVLGGQFSEQLAPYLPNFNLKEAIENKKVRWEEYRVPGNLTKSRNKEEDKAF